MRRGDAVVCSTSLDDLVKLVHLVIGIDLTPQRDLVGDPEGELFFAEFGEQRRVIAGIEVEHQVE